MAELDFGDGVFVFVSVIILLVAAWFFSVVYFPLNIPLVMYAVLHFVLWLDFKFPLKSR